MAASEERPAPGWRARAARVGQGTLLALAALLAVLVAARAVAPVLLERQVERAFDEQEGYDGRVADVDLALWRGAYRIEGLEVTRQTGQVPVPFFRVDAVDLSVEWKALLHGRVVGEIELVRPQLNFVAARDEAAEQSGEGADWREAVAGLFPVQINHFAVREGEVHFRNFQSEPPVDLWLEDIAITARNLTNVRDREQRRPARAEARARALGGGELEALLRADPLAPAPDFELQASLRDVDVARLNDFFQAYGSFDVQRGNLTVVLEVDARDGRFEGYVKPLLRELDVLDTAQEEDLNPVVVLWESFVGTLAEALENQPESQLATRIPLSGRIEDPEAGIIETLVTLLRNAYVEALRPRYERALGLAD